jgi:FKBP-type peptidyl-prolyl cis-trans isomerase 2
VAVARFEPVVGAQTAQGLRVVAMPSERALADLTHGLAGQTVKLTDRVFGLGARAASSAPAVVKRTASRKAARRAH